MEIKEMIGKEIIVLQVNGRVDTITSPKMQGAILNALQDKKELVLDFTEVEYVSSAGLRSLLIGHKTAVSGKKKMVLKHVPEIVKEVFSMTGFDQVLNIE